MTELKANGTCDFCGEACNADMQGAKAYDCEDFPMALTGAIGVFKKEATSERA
jgi:hypothetical protein